MRRIYLQNRNRLTDIENKFMVAKGDSGEELGVWDQQTHITIHKTDKQQGFTVQHREIYSLVITYNGKVLKKSMYVYTFIYLNHFAVHLKLTYYCNYTSIKILRKHRREANGFGRR